MKPSNKTLGLCGVMSAPFLTLAFISSYAAGADRTSIGGLFCFIYMSGWMCSIVGLMNLKAAGSQKRDNILFCIQLVLLSIANVRNIWVMIDPTDTSTFFSVLDLCWPLCNLFMLVLGIVIAKKGVLSDWQRYVVLITGLWLPFALGMHWLIGGDSYLACFPGAVYSVIAWSLLGWTVYDNNEAGSADHTYAI